MGTFTSPKVESGMKLEDLANLVAMLIEEMDYLLNGQIDAKNVRAKSITAEKLKVNELSAISANLGKVVAGILIGAYISTADGTYPRIDFSSQNKLLQAFLTATNSIYISPSYTGNPALVFENGTITAFMSAILGTLSFNAMSGDLQINAQSGDLSLLAGGGSKRLRIDSWDRTYSVEDRETLQQALNKKLNLIPGAFTGSFSTGTQTVNVLNGIISSVF